MASPLDDQQVSNLSSSVYQKILSQFQGEWVPRLNIDQMFVLIDGVLPFEACLYYQVLPLFLEGNRLHLGMVSPDDSSASEYVRRIISYLNYSLVSHSIASEALRVVLTAYLNHTGNQQDDRGHSFSSGYHRHASRGRIDRKTSPNERLTLVVDSPDELSTTDHNLPQTGSAVQPPAASPSLPAQPAPEFATPESVTRIETAREPDPELDPETEELPTHSHDRQSSQSRDEAQAVSNHAVSNHKVSSAANSGANSPADDTRFGSEVSYETSENAESTHSPIASHSQHSSAVVESNSPGQPLAILHVKSNPQINSVEALLTLSPQDLVQELLARVLLDGIGRLYFECYDQHGRVIWSQNGVLQSVLDRVALPLFQGVIQELKTMAKITTPVRRSEQAEIEYLYERSRVLLRFRFMPGTHGEEATVQVLRGAALKFYQQQQLNNLEKDALSIAKQLQNKLNEIRTRAYVDPNLIEARLEMLPQLSQLLQSIEQQVNALSIEKPE